MKPGVLEIGSGFRDDLGYYRRTDVRKWMLDMGIRPRFASLRALGVREMHPHVVWAYYERPGDREMIAKNLHTGYTFFLTNGGYVELSANPRFERIDTPFAVDPSVPAIAPGGYGWTEWQLRGSTDASRVVSSDFTFVTADSGRARSARRTSRRRCTRRRGSDCRAAMSRTSARLAGENGPALRRVALYGADELLVLDGGVRRCAHAVRSAHEAAQRERAAQRDSPSAE